MIWRLGWRLTRFRPWVTLLGTAAWIVFFTVPLMNGLVLRAIFDRLTRHAPATSALALVAVLAAVSSVQLSLLFGAWVSWMRAWFIMATLLRVNMLDGVVHGPGPATQRLPASSGEAVSRFRDDVDDLIWFVDVHLDVVGGVIFAVVALIVMAQVDARMTLLAAVPLASVVAINRMLTARLRSYRRRYRVATAGVAAFLGELFASVLAVRTNGAEDRVLARFERANRERRRAAVRDQVSTDGLIAANGMSVELAVGVVLLVAASTLRRHAFTIGDLALFTAYVEQLSALPRRMGRLLAFHRHATISVERMRQLTEGDPQRLVHPAPVYLKEAPPAPAAAPRHTAPFALLEVRGLTVCHPETGRGVFEVELTATPGAVTALTGEVGAGKSSLCRGLLGLVPVTSGSIRWNGVEVTDPGAFFVPPRAAYVPQVPHLFSESLADNILLGLPGDSVDLASVLALAAFDGDVDGMDDGLATRLGARGVRLSGGQLQRAAIARALVRAPELLVIDDPSSALDVATEERLWDGLLVPRRTCLIVSHRRAVLERADHVIVLDDGHVVDAGPPDVVLARGSVPTRAAG